MLTLKLHDDDEAIVEGSTMAEHSLHLAQLELPIEHLMKAQINLYNEKIGSKHSCDVQPTVCKYAQAILHDVH